MSETPDPAPAETMLAKVDSGAITPPIAKDKAQIIAGDNGLQLTSFDDMWRFARAAIASGLTPKGIDTPEKALICLQMGAEVGLSPMASLQNIAPINGRPTIWGDAVPAVCARVVENYRDEQIGTIGSDDFGYRVSVKRAGRTDPTVRTFTIAHAKKAGLWGKQGPWSQYPERMLLMRARTFAYRDSCPDALRGLYTTEEIRDMGAEPKNVTPGKLDDVDKQEGAA